MSAVVEISFFCPKNVGFLFLNWGGWLMQPKQLIDCGPMKIKLKSNYITIIYHVTALVGIY